MQIAARLGLARLALVEGEAQIAREEVLRALELDPARPDVLTMLGRGDLTINEMFAHHQVPLEFQVSLTNLYALITRNHTRQPTSNARMR